jgi:hypothetical protein
MVETGSLIAVLGWFVYVRYISHPPRFYYEPTYGAEVEFESLVSQTDPNIEEYLPLVVFAGFILVGLTVLIGSIRKPLRITALAVSGVVVANLCSFILYVGAILLDPCDTRVNSKQSISFGGLIYNLALVTNTTSDCDAWHWTYVLYECDESDATCRARYIHPYDYASLPEYHTGTLLLDAIGDTLQLQVDGFAVYTVQATEAVSVEDNGT